MVNQPKIVKYWIYVSWIWRILMVIMSCLCRGPFWLGADASPSLLIRGSSLHTMGRGGKAKMNWVFFPMLLAIGKLSTKASQESPKVAKTNISNAQCCKLCKYWTEERNLVNGHFVEFTFDKLPCRELAQSYLLALHSQLCFIVKLNLVFIYLLWLYYPMNLVFRRPLTVHFVGQETVV